MANRTSSSQTKSSGVDVGGNDGEEDEEDEDDDVDTDEDVEGEDPVGDGVKPRSPRKAFTRRASVSALMPELIREDEGAEAVAVAPACAAATPVTS
jgi:hypothetical protein